MLYRYTSAAFSRPKRSLGQMRTFIAKPPPLQDLQTSDDMNAARRWIEELRQSTIPREEVTLSFARSSGPGGQVRETVLVQSVEVLRTILNSMIPTFNALERQQSEHQEHREMPPID